ncbi:hypothetical protein EDD28_0031 [Salana multivorans]|uniref:Uncharacterized protein n=1 Tax=Salana multivorans TaxID=120377 RepID=A0A3N2D748_9MICO|nr:hypothetical protein [Salana multivorans]ROR95478.1 hypothetical protein EDD28_0031 [Salana multivorans]
MKLPTADDISGWWTGLAGRPEAPADRTVPSAPARLEAEVACTEDRPASAADAPLPPSGYRWAADVAEVSSVYRGSPSRGGPLLGLQLLLLRESDGKAVGRRRVFGDHGEIPSMDDVIEAMESILKDRHALEAEAAARQARWDERVARLARLERLAESLGGGR